MVDDTESSEAVPEGPYDWLHSAIHCDAHARWHPDCAACQAVLDELADYARNERRKNEGKTFLDHNRNA